jgi:hypothetical protein
VEAKNAEIVYTPANAWWSNRIEAQFTALRYIALDGTGHATTSSRADYLGVNHTYDERPRCIVARAMWLDAALAAGNSDVRL